MRRRRYPDYNPPLYSENASKLPRFLNLFVHGLALNDVLPLRFYGEDYLCQPYSYCLEVVTAWPAYYVSLAVGKSVTLAIRHDNHSVQWFHGRVFRIVTGEEAYDGYTPATLVMMPDMVALNHNRGSFRYSELSVPDIIKAELRRHHITDVDFYAVTKDYEPLPYCVRFDESSFHFIHRLMETWGIYYFFHHRKGRHTMVFNDCPWPNARAPEPLMFMNERGGDKPHLHRFTRHFRAVTSQINMMAANPWRPAGPFKTTVRGGIEQPGCPAGVAEGKHVYLTHVGVRSEKTLTWLAQVMLRSEQVPARSFSAAGNCPGLYAGMRFEVHSDEDPKINGDFYLSWMRHFARDTSGCGDDEAHLESEPQTLYCNEMEGHPEEIRYAAPQNTGQVEVPGVLPAVVTGPAGFEVYTDNYASVKVQPQWDRVSDFDESSSKWVRTAQQMAGDWHGSQFIPRVGENVLLQFADGNPDLPAVAGAVHHALHRHPFDVSSQSGIRTRSLSRKHQGEGHQLRFDDTAGAEELLIKSQKDHEVQVKGDSRSETAKDSTVEVRRGDGDISAGGDIIIKAEKELRLHVGSSEVVLNAAGVHVNTDTLTEVTAPVKGTEKKHTFPPPAGLHKTKDVSVADVLASLDYATTFEEDDDSDGKTAATAQTGSRKQKSDRYVPVEHVSRDPRYNSNTITGEKP